MFCPWKWRSYRWQPRPGIPALPGRASSTRTQRRGAATWAAESRGAEGTAGRPGVGRRRSRQNNKEDDKCLVRCLFSKNLKGLKLVRATELSRVGSPEPPTARPF